MFDIGATELLVIGIVALVVVGPKELPTLLRTFGQYVGKMRSMARDFQRQLEDAARDSGLDEVRKSVTDVQKMSPAKQVKDAVDPIRKEAEAVTRDIQKPISTEPAPAAGAMNGGTHAPTAGTAEGNGSSTVEKPVAAAPGKRDKDAPAATDA